MPLDRFTATARLKVHLEPLMADGRAEQLLQHLDQSGMLEERRVSGMPLLRMHQATSRGRSAEWLSSTSKTSLLLVTVRDCSMKSVVIFCSVST